MFFTGKHSSGNCPNTDTGAAFYIALGFVHVLKSFKQVPISLPPSLSKHESLSVQKGRCGIQTQVKRVRIYIRELKDLGGNKKALSMQIPLHTEHLSPEGTKALLGCLA